MKYLVLIEAVNFSATIDDTDDLSTIRGSSLAALWAPKAILGLLCEQQGFDLDIVFAGASQAVAEITTKGTFTRDELETLISDTIVAVRSPSGTPAHKEVDELIPVLPFLSFTFAAIAYDGNYQEDVLTVAARARKRQMQQLTLDVPLAAPGAWRACQFDSLRPATEKIKVGDTSKVVSRSVFVRRAFGRNMRQAFYSQELGANHAVASSGHEFANSFEDLIIGGPDGLPPSVLNKMAIFYFDGNQFTKARNNFVHADNGGDSRTKQAEFSSHVVAQRRQLLDALLQDLMADKHMYLQADNRPERLRFETLMWGGDEASFVLPAWKAFDAVSVLAKQLTSADWKIGDQQLTHALGLVICNYKTPIRAARKLVKEIVDFAKSTRGGRCENKFSFHVFESMELPTDLATFRQKIYGTCDVNAFVSVLDNIEKTLHSVVRAARSFDDDTAISRSQLYGLINDLKLQNAFSQAGAGSQLLQDVLSTRPVSYARKSALEKLETGGLGYGVASPLLPLLRLAETWDYIEPRANERDAIRLAANEGGRRHEQQSSRL